MTQFTEEEIKMRCGFFPPEGEWTMEERESIAKSFFEQGEHFAEKSLASSLDLSAFLNPSVDQGNCGSCVAFGTLAAAEGTVKYAASDPNMVFKLSEPHLFYCHAYSEGATCNGFFSGGWYPERAVIALQQKGVVGNDCFPHNEFVTPQACKLCPDWVNSLTFSTGYSRLRSVSEMKRALEVNGPLVASISVYADFQGHTSEVYEHRSGGYLGGHCICVCGYDDDKQCWIVRNSWGPNWNGDGFFKIRYGQCGIDAEMWAIYM